jgi:hypothetical protein
VSSAAGPKKIKKILDDPVALYRYRYYTQGVSQTLKQRKTKMTNSITTFTAGKTYFCNWIGDADLKTPFEIVRRSQKSVWIKGGEMNDRNAVVRRSIEIIDHEETFSPFGKYSMSPITRAAHVCDSSAVAGQSYRA